MGLEMYRCRARADGTRVEGGAEGCLRAVGSVRALRYHFAFGAAVLAVLLLNPATALSQAAPPASDQHQPPEATAKPPESEAVEHVKIEGFRSARWGMDAAQVKAAIQKDFGVPTEKMKTEENAAERTTVLTITVSDLLEGAGPARISYILGYKTKKLIQVTVLWGTPVDPQAQPEKIVTAANQLRQLFLDSGDQPEAVVANDRMADGTIRVSPGQDTDKHTTVLRPAHTSAPPKGSRAEAAGASVVLSLSYILDSRSPDIFRLKKGQF